MYIKIKVKIRNTKLEIGKKFEFSNSPMFQTSGVNVCKIGAFEF